MSYKIFGYTVSSILNWPMLTNLANRIPSIPIAPGTFKTDYLGKIHFPKFLKLGNETKSEPRLPDKNIPIVTKIAFGIFFCTWVLYAADPDLDRITVPVMRLIGAATITSLFWHIMNIAKPVRIVLQGEFAAVKSTYGHDSIIKTPIPQIGTILTLYNEESKIAVLAHIDGHTDAVQAMDKIRKVLIKKYNTPIETCQFKAKILCRTKAQMSNKQQEAVSRILAGHQIKAEIVPLADDKFLRPQIALNARNGDMIFLTGNEINERLEFLQLREYGKWNTIFGTKHRILSDAQIPGFKLKEAARTERDIPPFEMKNVADARKQEQKKKFVLPIQAERKIVPDKEGVIEKLKNLIKSDAHAKFLNKAIDKQDFNLLLRQASVYPEHLKLLKCLLSHKKLLNIDIDSRGKQSGTAMDIANKYNNQQAIALLNQFK